MKIHQPLIRPSQLPRLLPRLGRSGLPKGALALALCFGGGLTACGDAGEIEPWDGTLRSGVQAMSEEAEGGRIDAALSIADQMLAPGATARLRERLNGATRGVSESVLSPITGALDLVGISALQPSDRAEIEYARAATLLLGASKGDEDAPGLLGRAETALERARGAAPGDVRKSAVYNQGTLDLMAGEAVRATIPEIAGPDAAGPTAPPDPNKTEEEDAPDPLDVARALYLQSRTHFIEYLTDGEGEDAAANVELVIRRLRELDEIEKQREEQKEEDSEEGEDGEKEDQEPSDEDQEKKDDQKSEDEPSEDEQKSEEEGEDDPSEDPSEEEPEEEPEEESEDEGEEEEGEPEEEPQPGEEKIEETTMTAEEFQRLLKQNEQHQERGEEIRRIRTIRGKIPAKKDW